MTHRIVSTLILATLAACGPRYAAPIEDADEEASRDYDDGSEEADLVLRAANELSLDILDDALDVRAAEGIVDARPFGTIAELDAVPYVGLCALDDLYALAVDHFGSSTDPLTAEEEEALILQAANTLDFEVLDDDVGLDVRAAQGIVDQRPFSTLPELDAVSYVGPVALGDLLDFALQTWGAPADDCPTGLILGSSGAEYTDLGDAIRHSPANEVLTLCDGRFALSDAVIDRNLTIEGQGIRQSTVFSTTGHAVEVTGTDVEVTFRDLTFADSVYGWGVVKVQWYALLTLDHTSFEDIDGQALAVYRAGVVLQDGNEFLRTTDIALYAHGYSTVQSTNSLFADNAGSGVRLWDTDATFDGDRFHRNDGPDGAVYVSIDWNAPWTADFTDVDFGIGTTENAGHDVVRYRTTSAVEVFDTLVEHTDLHCFYDGCDQL